MGLTPSAAYQLLGLPENAPEDEVRRAYRKLARKLHPDLTGGRGGDHGRFTEITAAYNLLTGRGAAAREKTQSPAAKSADPDFDADKAYAEFKVRAAAWRAANGSRAPKPAAEPIVVSPATQAAQAADPAPAARVVAEEVKTGLWSRLRAKLRRAAPVEGADVYLTLQVDLSTVLRGGEQAIQIQRAAACPTCAGAASRSDDCVCSGAGRVLVRERLKVQVPAGAKAGAKLRLAGKGNDGIAGHAAGDLYLLLDPAGVPGYLRDGAHLRGTLEIDAAHAAAGGPVTVPTPWGAIRLDVPAGSRSGVRFRLQGQGLPQWRKDARGDLFLKVQVR